MQVIMLRGQALSFAKKLSVFLIAATILVFPIFFLPITTDPFETPKQLLLTIVTLILLVLFGLRGVLEGRYTFRRTPFDIGLIVFFVTIVASILLSPSRAVALIGGVPLLTLVIFTFLVIQTITTASQERVVLVAALIGGILLSILAIMQLLNVYILPYPIAKTAGFSLTGSLMAACLFLALLLPVGLTLARSSLRKREDNIWGGVFIASSLLIGIGLIISLYQLFTAARPILLPQEVGLGSAFHSLAINFQTALFGTGPGTFLFDFTRFRDPSLNTTSVWNLRFTNSSSLFLELLATVGLVGALSFLFLAFRTLTTFLKGTSRQAETMGVFFALAIGFLLSLLLPFSFAALFLLFVLLALYVIRLANESSPNVFDVTISVVALRKGLIAVERESTIQRPATDLLPYIMFLIFLLFSAFVVFGLPGSGAGLSLSRFFSSDITFQKALFAASQNNAQETLQLQGAAIKTFPNRDSYHRVFSQTNLTIANFIAQRGRNATPSGQQVSSPSGGLSDQDRQTIISLVRQSINSGRIATTLSPLNVVNWENLSNVYRNLIGFAQNADQFAIASAQQAVALDQNNPLLHIHLGGIFFQLKQYDNAIGEFVTAAKLKPDLANAYYNLGHAFEAKGDTDSLKNALPAYQTVRSLVKSDSDDFKKIEEEIAALQKKIPQPTAQEKLETSTSSEQQEPLRISSPSGNLLPPQKPPLEVEGPPATGSGKKR